MSVSQRGSGKEENSCFCKEMKKKGKKNDNNICLFVIADIWALTAAIQDIGVQLEDKAACLMSQWVK